MAYTKSNTVTEDHSVLHVIARNQGNPPLYYYRQWIDSSRWNAWTKIDLDIVSDHIMPIVWNRRLYLFWAIINRKPHKEQTIPVMSTTGDSPNKVKTYLEVQLAWSEFKGRKWLAKQTAPQKLFIPDDIEPYQVAFRTTIIDPLLHIDLFVPTDSLTDLQHYGGFVLGGVGNSVEAFTKETNYSQLSDIGPETHNIGVFKGYERDLLSSPLGNKWEAMNLVPREDYIDYDKADRQRISICYASKSQPILYKADYYRLMIPHQQHDFGSNIPFFYSDGFRSYFIIPIHANNGDLLHSNTRYLFAPFYHAFVPLFIRELNRGGVDRLLRHELQDNPAKVQGIQPFLPSEFNSRYAPTDKTITDQTAEGIDFEFNAGYAIYNWELFFHAPFLIGEALSRNQRFEEAKHWYEYIFNPTNSTFDPIPKRYWVTKPFYNREDQDYENQRIQKLMNLINHQDMEVEKQVAQWRDDPFNPHLIAQSRQVAYQRAIVMKYIDNLIAWGDMLFNQDTMESLNEATQMYVLASELLGPRPEIVKPLGVPEELTYAELEPRLDDLSNASVLAAENLLGPIQLSSPTNDNASRSGDSGTSQGITVVTPGTPQLPTFYTLYFSIPPNDQLLGYWDTVADRLFKIRHGMNIKGVKREVALFAPPIDPGLLVRAAAAGLDLGSILSDMNITLPPYRFRVMVREAIELCEMVRGFGNELLGVLEKKDAEDLAVKRSGYEKKLQGQIRAVMQRKLDEADQQIDIIAKQRQTCVERQAFYGQRKNEMTNKWEAAALIAQGAALVLDIAANLLEIASGVAHAIPKFQFGGSGAGGTPHATTHFGGENIGYMADSESKALRIASAILHTTGQMSLTIGSYQRRKEEWELQYNIATNELASFDSQTLAALIRKDIAQKELENHEINVELADKVDEFLHSKYTNQELYDWMISQTSATYFQAYQLAYSVAKSAEQCFRQELGLNDSAYIQFGYWDSLKKGLLSGDKLLYDLQRLKSAYYAQNARELEITKHVSLLTIDPFALVDLRNKGACTLKLPEILFDMDNPGHYMRRIKSVGLSVPCVVGPYTGVSMTLTLNDNHVRTNPLCGDEYKFFADDNTEGFVNDQGGISAIVTSSAQNDRGVFELRYDDERYLPFECAGAISTWTLKLNPVYPQFDYKTISDVILHLQYTARDGGDSLRTKVNDAVRQNLKNFALAESRSGLYCLINVRHEYGTNWQKFLNPGIGPQELTIDIAPDRLPFFTNGLNISIKGIDFYAKMTTQEDYNLIITLPGSTTAEDPALLSLDTVLKFHHFSYSDKSDPKLTTPVSLGNTLSPNEKLTWCYQIQKNEAPIGSSEIEDLLLILHYEVSELME